METIVLKAKAKGAEERYASAQEFGDDLRRFLEDRPIRARRPTLRHRGRKWPRRHKTVLRAAGVVCLLAVVALAVSAALIWQANRRLNQTIGDLNESLERERAGSPRPLRHQLYEPVRGVQLTPRGRNQPFRGRLGALLEGTARIRPVLLMLFQGFSALCMRGLRPRRELPPRAVA